MIRQEQWQGESVHILENDKLSVTLCPSINNNVIRVWDRTLNRDVLRMPDSPEALRQNPAHFGTPILVPPNRIKSGAFTFEGRNYQFNVNRPNHMHNHGILQELPWKLKEVREDGKVITAVSTFRTSDYPDVLTQYPHDMGFEVTYKLDGAQLSHSFKASNFSDRNAPFGFGLHTWFLLNHKPESWTFTLPAAGIWELGGDLLPTGRILPLGKLTGLPQGITLEGADLDTVFLIGNNPHTATLENERCVIRYSAPSDAFKHWVIYTKGTADNFICAEPYTWVTNAPNLEIPREKTGLLGIAPGETLELEVVLEIDYK